jgi:ribonuclease P protein component
MLSASRRLRTSEVAEVLKSGRGLASGQFLSAKALASGKETDATIRSAAVISKKVAKTAVARNRARRALYAAIEAASRELRVEGLPPMQIVFFIRSMPQGDVRSEFKIDLEKIIRSLPASNLRKNR